MNTAARYRVWLVPMAAVLLELTGCTVGSSGEEAKARLNLQQADLYLEQQLPDSALAAFGLALEYDPTLAQAHVGMGDIYRGRGDLDMASRAYGRAARLAPGNFKAQYYLGETLQALGHLAESVKAYLQAIAIDPYSFDANRNLAAAYLQLEQPANALPYARRATELRSEDPNAWYNLGRTQLDLGQNKEAAKALKYAAALGQPAVPILESLAVAQNRVGEYEQAAATLGKLLQDQPSAAVYNQLGLSQFHLRQYAEALGSYRAALKLEEKNTSALNGAGACLMTLYVLSNRADGAQRDEALDCWRKSLQLNTSQPRIVDLLSRYQRL